MPRISEPPPSSSLLFRHASRKVRRTPLRHFLKEAAGKIVPGRPVSCLITTDEELRRLNHQFRGKNQPTDVLSFPGEQLGELAISFDRASEQAAAMGHGIEEELRILMLHGILHLKGMDHETDAGEMARAERRWRKRLGLRNNLIERSAR